VQYPDLVSKQTVDPVIWGGATDNALGEQITRRSHGTEKERVMKRELAISFTRNWVDASHFEEALQESHMGPHDERVSRVVFQIPEECKLMIDAGIRLLSLSNQLDFSGKAVTLDFAEGPDGTMGYLSRMGFFDFLCEGVEVLPDRPFYSGAQVYRGYNPQLVEIERINPEERDEALPLKLSTVLERNVGHGRDNEAIGTAAYTVFSELIDNIFRHSSTKVDGFASLQVYKGGGRAKVVVSDSGEGILNTLRPSLTNNHPRLVDYSDTGLIVEAFRNGLSRFGKGNGCGLRTCAIQAIKFRADLDVRLHTSRVHLVPSADGYQPSTAYCSDNLHEMWGTHICFDFVLDR